MPLSDEVLKRKVVILDGGMSNALEDRGHDLSDDLWTARLLRDDPAEIVAVHRAYFEAGADGRDDGELPGQHARLDPRRSLR